MQDRVKLDEPAGEVALDSATALRTPVARPSSRSKICASLRRIPRFRSRARRAFLRAQDRDNQRRPLRPRAARAAPPAIELRGGVVRADVDANGVLNLQQLAPAPDPAPQEHQQHRARRPGASRSLRCAFIALRYRDFTRLTPLELGVGALELGLSAGSRRAPAIRA